MPQPSAFSSDKTHLLDARILSFQVGGKENYVSPEEVHGIEVRFTSEEAFDTLAQTIRIMLHLSIDILTYSDAEDEAEAVISLPDFGSFSIGFMFTFDNYDELIQLSDGDLKEVKVDSMAMLHLFAMAYSTARGMILVKTRGTSLEGTILPIIDPSTFMEKGFSQPDP